MHKILLQRVTGGKIADTPESDLPVCVRGGRPKVLHMGSPRSHNEIVRILGATYTAPFGIITFFWDVGKLKPLTSFDLSMHKVWMTRLWHTSVK